MSAATSASLPASDTHGIDGRRAAETTPLPAQHGGHKRRRRSQETPPTSAVAFQPSSFLDGGTVERQPRMVALEPARDIPDGAALLRPLSAGDKVDVLVSSPRSKNTLQ